MSAVIDPLPQSGRWRERDDVTVKDWEACRQIFVQLYIEENRKLEEIMETMRTAYGFTATYVQGEWSVAM